MVRLSAMIPSLDEELSVPSEIRVSSLKLAANEDVSSVYSFSSSRAYDILWVAYGVNGMTSDL